MNVKFYRMRINIDNDDTKPPTKQRRTVNPYLFINRIFKQQQIWLQRELFDIRIIWKRIAKSKQSPTIQHVNKLMNWNGLQYT